MDKYMRYQGRAVEVFGYTRTGQQVPVLYPGDKGERVGDYAMVDDLAMEWDGRAWVPSEWYDLQVWGKVAS